MSVLRNAARRNDGIYINITMGEHKLLRCTDCQQYANVGKIRRDYGDGAGSSGNHELAVWFLNQHKGCTIELVGEYGGTQERWAATNEQNGWVEVDYE